MISIDFKVGDYVKLLTDDVEAIKIMQKGHGGWTDEMFLTLTQHVGRVVKLYSDNDIRVSVLGKEWTLNPACLRKATPGETHKGSVDKANGFITKRDEESFVRSCANGDLQTVRLLVEKFPLTLSSKTVFCHNLLTTYEMHQ